MLFRSVQWCFFSYTGIYYSCYSGLTLFQSKVGKKIQLKLPSGHCVIVMVKGKTFKTWL